MIKNSLGLHLSTLKGAHDARHLAMKVKAAAEAGFAGVCLDAEDIEGWLGTPKTLRELNKVVKDSGLAVYYVGDALVCDEAGNVKDPTALFAAAAALGAPIVGAIYNNAGAEMSRAREDWSKFVEMVSDVDGVAPALHFRGDSARYNSFSEAWDIVSSSSPANGCLLLDLYDYWRGASTAATLEMVPPELLRMVFLSDAANVPRIQATDNDRVFPGEGVMPLTHIVSTLCRRGYEGSFAVKALRGADKEACGARAMKAFNSARRLLGTSGPSHRKQPNVSSRNGAGGAKEAG